MEYLIGNPGEFLGRKPYPLWEGASGNFQSPRVDHRMYRSGAHDVGGFGVEVARRAGDVAGGEL